jgi:hypothetical protein
MRRQYANWWIGAIPLLVVGVLFTGCNGPAASSSKEEPATIEKIAGGDLSKITLTEKAGKRLALETVPVKLETVIRMRRVAGEVMAVRAASGKTSGISRVKVALNRSDMVKVNRGQQARVVEMGLDDGEDSDGDAAELSDVSDKGNADDTISSSLQYTVTAGKTKLMAGQKVFVELPVSGKVQRSTVPYTAVIYDLKGDTWVYTSPAPLTYVRHHIKVDYIDDDTAILTEGPPVGTNIVSVGVEELFGTEFGIGN